MRKLFPMAESSLNAGHFPGGLLNFQASTVRVVSGGNKGPALIVISVCKEKRPGVRE